MLMALTEVIDDHVLAQYRALLDAEDAAFDDLAHAYEEGKRENFEADLILWRHAIDAKLHYLRRLGVPS